MVNLRNWEGLESEKVKYRVAILILSLLAMFLTIGVTLADEGDIEVLEQKAKSDFPEGIRFTVRARSSAEINDIRVFLTIFGNARQTTYRTAEFEPGTEVTARTLLASGGLGSYFPPGTKIDYFFEISDNSGALHRTEKQEFVYEDGRFKWLTITSGLITVYYYGEYVENRANTVLDAATETLSRMLPVLGIEPKQPLRIVAYNNYRHMAEALPFRSQATTERLRTEGMAFSDERVLLVHGFGATIRGTTSHEFTHLLVSEAAGRADAQVPAWLNEGLAEYGNIDPTDDYDAALRYGIFTQRIKPLWFQASFTGTPDDIIIAYGQGRSVVAHLINTYGKAKMAELMSVLRQTRDIDEAMLRVYGFDQYGLDTEWRELQGMKTLPPPAQSLDGRPAKQNPIPKPTGTPTPPSTSKELKTSPPVQASAAPTFEPPTLSAPAVPTEDAGLIDRGSCSVVTSHVGTAIRPDLAVLALLATPLGLLLLRRP